MSATDKGGAARFWFDDPNALLDRSHVLEIWPEPSMSFERKLNAISRAIIGMMLIGSLVAERRDLIVTSAAVSLLGLVILYRTKNRSGNGNAIQSQVRSSSEGFLNLLGVEGDGIEGGTDDATCGCSETEEELVHPQRELVHADARACSSGPRAETQKTYERNPFGNVLVPDYGTAAAMEEGGAPPSSSEIYEMVKRNAARTFDVEAQSAGRGFDENDAERAKEVEEEENDIKDKLFMNLGDNYVFENSMRNYATNPCTTVANDQDGFARFCYGEMRSQKEDGVLAAA